jgi:3-dehydroquinate synthase
MTILGAMESFHLLRQSEPVVAIGGGVLLDAVGFAASIYRRGVPYIRVPTTLLALVDASVGAKTSVNHFGRRNRLGAYHVPVASYLDRTFLTTLERVEFSNGLAEILKMSLIKDRRLFELLEASGRDLIDERFQRADLASEVIDRAITTMLEELEPNLWEKELKRSVDFGHSFSPMIEMRALPELSHGQAVTLDVLFSCLLCHRRGLLSLGELERIIATVERLELPVFHPLFGDPEVLCEALADTVLHRNGNQNLPMVPTIGSVTFFDDVTAKEIEQSAMAFRELLGDRER